MNSIKRFAENNMLILSSLVMLGLDVLAYCALRTLEGEKANAFAAIIASSVVILGYFYTHSLEAIMEQRRRELDRGMDMMAKLRFLLLEQDKADDRSKMRDEWQDAYYAYALTAPAESYKALSNTMASFEAFLQETNVGEKEHKKKRYVENQAYLVNCFRKDFGVDDEIDFQAYDYQLK